MAALGPRLRLSPRLTCPRGLVAFQSFSTTLHANVTRLHAFEYVTKSKCSVGGAAWVLVACSYFRARPESSLSPEVTRPML